jgi:hypothetical protein
MRGIRRKIMKKSSIERRALSIQNLVARYLLLVVFLLLFTIHCSLFTTVEAYAAEIVGKFTHVEGKVEVLRGGRFPALSAGVGTLVNVDDIIRTKSDSKAEITFNDGNVVRIAERSRISISEYTVGNRASISMPAGKVEAIVTKARRVSVSGGNRFEIATPNAIAGVRGTDYFVSYAGNITEVFVKEGEVAVHNLKFPEAPIVVGAGNITVVEPHKPPESPKPATPDNIKQFEKGVMPEIKAETKIEAKAETKSGAEKVPSNAPQTQDELKRFIGCSK